MARTAQARDSASFLDQLDDRSVAVVLGTRPEMVKMSGMVRLLGAKAAIVHTGQHYSNDLSDVFFDELELPEPAHRLQVGGASRSDQIRSAISALSRILAEEPFEVVVVQGDTNTTLAGAVAANALDLPLVHVEAGLRSFDRRMPEEHNRVVADHLADLLLAPTEDAKRNLTNEAIAPHRVRVTGNTVVEALTRYQPDSVERKKLLTDLGIDTSFVLATFHRPENVDDGPTLARIIDQLGRVEAPVVLPMHPRTRNEMEAMEVDLPENLSILEPLGYVDFIALEAECDVLISDSGGVQEESSIVKRPVVVVRRSTERPEVVGTFARLTTPGPHVADIANEWLADIDAVHANLATIPSPYGDDTAPAASVEAIATLITSS